MGRNKEKDKGIARERIEILFKKAEEKFDDHPQLAHRYVALARRISLKLRLRIPRELKRMFCKKCNAYWVPGKTVRIRTTQGKLTFTCLLCGNAQRMPFLREKSAQKKK